MSRYMDCDCFRFSVCPVRVYDGADWIVLEDLLHTKTVPHYLFISRTCETDYYKLPYHVTIELLQIAAKLVKDYNVYNHRLFVNNGSFQHIKHVHWHLTCDETN